MKRNAKKAGELQAGMGNLSEEGRDYITTMVRAMLSYQNSLDLPGETAAGPDKAKNAPGVREPESPDRGAAKTWKP
ncbi:MAG: hypothetical protein LBQ46_02760 [Treponema sp.]|nr:hypothetical protein [Treponema sp.]